MNKDLQKRRILFMDDETWAKLAMISADMEISRSEVVRLLIQGKTLVDRSTIPPTTKVLVHRG